VLAINALSDSLPVAATSTAGVVSLAAKIAGEWGNDLLLDADDAGEQPDALECVNDIFAPAQCGFDVGDDDSYDSLADLVKHGKSFKVYLNDRLRMTGRVYVNEIPVDPTSGSTVNLVVRSILADAHYASADPTARVQDTAIADFLLAI
jgi:hypothetical protein